MLNECTSGPPAGSPCPAIGVSPSRASERELLVGGQETGFTSRSLITPEFQRSGAPLGESCLCSSSFSFASFTTWH